MSRLSAPTVNTVSRSESAAQIIARISQLFDAFPRIRELDLNPCRVYGSGIAVLDARVVLENL